MKKLLPLLVIVFATSCSKAPGTEGASCPNDNNCIAPLKCIDLICQMPLDDPDAGPVDTGPVDTGVIDMPDTGIIDAGNPVPVDNFATGTLQTLPGGNTLGYTLAGRGGMVREITGYTDVRIVVEGLTPGEDYNTHVHVLPCSEEGGGHYKFDLNIEEAEANNEIWPNITNVDVDGRGTGSLRVNHFARDEAVAIVVHDYTDGTKIACVDLAPNNDYTTNGTFIELTAGQGSGITGTAMLRRYPGGTTATVMLEGNLTPDAVYPAHVHAAPCDLNEGGGHYKVDEALGDDMEANEIWPQATANAAGDMAMGSVTVNHLARFSAYSIVVHDPDNNDKLLCADLDW